GNPGPATAFVLEGDGGANLAAYTDRLAYAQFDAGGIVAFNEKADLGTFGRPLDIAAKLDGRLMLVGSPEGFTGNGLQLAYIGTDGELSNIVQTSDTNPDTPNLLEGAPAVIAIASDGNVLVGGRADDGLAQAYQITKFDDGKVNAERPDEFTDARGNDIVRDSEGGIHVAYFDAALRVLKYAYCAPTGLWNAPVTVDGAPESGHYLSIAINADARPGIAYFDGTHGDLKYAFSAAGSAWTSEVVESRGSVGLYPSLQFDTAKRATVSYYKKTGGDLKLAVLGPEGNWTYELVDSENDVGRSTVLTPQPISGRWSIAYTDTTSGSVKLAWRTKQKVWQIEIAATTLGGADFLSLAYNPFTEPAGVYQKAAISYYDAHAADLKITQFNGSTWATRLLVSQGAQGLYTTLTFDALYGPSVYFYNRTADRVVRITDSVYDGMKADTIIEEGGRFLSVFSNGNTVDAAYFDDVEDVIKVRTLPLRG
ncbi:MAG: hypothetical protein WBD40_16025, partial [Tepidisphaeraceae bacterium]